jgi:cation diffusion facilitator family transporter
VNGALAITKLITGLVGNSYALLADSVESFADIFSSAMVWGGLTIASKPADDNHPYGHGKAEPLATLAVAAMLLLAAVGIAAQAIKEIRHPSGRPETYTLIVLVAIILVKELMYRYQSRAARLSGSIAVFADAWHHRCDALTSAAAAIGISITLIGQEGYETAEDWAALVACGVVAINGVRFAKMAVRELMDSSPSTQLADEISAVSHKVSGARFVEKVLIRKMGPRIYVDLHLEVEPLMTVESAHLVAHDVKDEIMRTWPEVADVLVHVEPHKPQSPSE